MTKEDYDDMSDDEVLETINDLEHERNRLRDLLEAIGTIRKTMKKPWKGKLHHDRDEFADWGRIRDEEGKLIAIVKFDCDDETLARHRREGTDPSQPMVDAILNLLNRQLDNTR
jgi:hypothetical protein